MNPKKERLDILLVERNIAPSRERAKALIMSGNIFVDGQREDKAGAKVSSEADIILKSNPNPYVSRGGLKLEKAVKSFGISLQDKVCMDVGASTGGFTDCMLQNNAAKVYSIDVGYGQLAWSLRQDERVVCMEKTNIRYVTEQEVADPIDFTSIDVSFISLKLVLPAVINLLKENGECVCLIKPQFEAGREKVGKKGVVRDKQTHYEVICQIIEFVLSANIRPLQLSYSPIRGPEGNIEYLLHIIKQEITDKDREILDLVKNIVDNAHEKI